MPSAETGRHLHLVSEKQRNIKELGERASESLLLIRTSVCLTFYCSSRDPMPFLTFESAGKCTVHIHTLRHTHTHTQHTHTHPRNNG